MDQNSVHASLEDLIPQIAKYVFNPRQLTPTSPKQRSCYKLVQYTLVKDRKSWANNTQQSEGSLLIKHRSINNAAQLNIIQASILLLSNKYCTYSWDIFQKLLERQPQRD